MKLYTEEQVRTLLSKHISNYWIDKHLSNITPIELPSDEEIEKEAKKYTESTPDNDPIRIMTFIKSAKWVIEQIKKQVIT